MKPKHITLSIVLAIGTVVTAQAEPLGQHPALLVQKKAPALDTNTFIVGHPAGGAWAHVHAGHEHPAVLVQRALNARIDSNTFLVQPPATVTWLPGSEPGLHLAKK